MQLDRLTGTDGGTVKPAIVDTKGHLYNQDN